MSAKLNISKETSLEIVAQRKLMRSSLAVYLLQTYLLLSTVMKKSLVKFYITVEELLDMVGNIGQDSFLFS